MTSPLKHTVDENAHKKVKLKILTGISNGIAEVKKMRKTGKKLQSLKEFLRGK